MALSGAAPIAPQVLEFFWALGVPVREGYGQTENTRSGHLHPVDDVRIGTVGRGRAGQSRSASPTTARSSPAGPGTFVGYFKDPEATAATVDADGWLHTGDVGELDADGFLTITDRKKDIIITAGGKNISPSEIENALKVSPYVREAIVIGDRRKYLTALIGIEFDTVGDWADAPRPHVHHLRGPVVQARGRRARSRDWVERGQRATSPRSRQIKAFRLLPRGARPRGRRAHRDAEGQARGDRRGVRRR